VGLGGAAEPAAAISALLSIISFGGDLRRRSSEPEYL